MPVPACERKEGARGDIADAEPGVSVMLFPEGVSPTGPDGAVEAFVTGTISVGRGALGDVGEDIVDTFVTGFVTSETSGRD